MSYNDLVSVEVTVDTSTLDDRLSTLDDRLAAFDEKLDELTSLADDSAVKDMIREHDILTHEDLDPDNVLTKDDLDASDVLERLERLESAADDDTAPELLEARLATVEAQLADAMQVIGLLRRLATALLPVVTEPQAPKLVPAGPAVPAFTNPSEQSQGY